jgi:hypothetical protein
MPAGRPKAIDKNPELLNQIAECFLVGFTDEQTALYCDISYKTIQRLRAGKFCPSVKRAELARETIYRLKIYDGAPNWQGIAWFLERKYPTQFAKPEIQLAVNQQVNTGPTNVVVLGPERAKLLATRYESIRAKTMELLDKQHTNGDNNGNSD